MIKSKKILKFLHVILLVLSINGLDAQIRQDSLYLKYKNESNSDSIRFLSLQSLAIRYIYNEPDSARALQEEALSFAETMPDDTLKFKLIARGYNILGVTYDYTGDFDMAIKIYKKSLELNKQINDLRGMSSCYNNLGSMYDAQSNFPLALEYYFKSLALKEKVEDIKGAGISINNIGGVYKENGELDKAMENFQKALKLYQEADYEKGIAGEYNNIASVYDMQGVFPEAAYYYSMGAAQCKKLDLHTDLATYYNNMGLLMSEYSEKSDSIILSDFRRDTLNVFFFIDSEEKINRKTLRDSAIFIQIEALKLNQSVGDLYGEVFSYSGLAKAYLIDNQIKLSIQNYKKACEIGEELHMISELRDVYRGLYEAHKQLNNHSEALKWHEKYMGAKDTIAKENVQKEIGHFETKYEYEKIQAKNEAAHEKAMAIADEEKKQQRIIIIAIVSVCALIVIFAIVIFRRLKITRRQKLLIEDQNDEISMKNAELEQYNEEVEAQRDQIENQKNIVEEKNKAITDSINYAQRIQNALLKNTNIKKFDIPEHFVLFKPRDIVSGDFYWTFVKGDYFYIAAVDCTGHGVPGAFMSMLGVSFLNQIMGFSEELKTGEILDLLRDKVIQELNDGVDLNTKPRDFDSEVIKDGMDMALLKINVLTNEIEFSGAYNPLYILRKQNNDSIEEPSNRIEVIKSDKQPIGIPMSKKWNKFTTHELKLTKGDQLYIFTDGYADQFGGKDERKFTYKKLKNSIVEGSELTLDVQKEKLDEEFENWKKGLHQLDDVCLIGVRF